MHAVLVTAVIFLMGVAFITRDHSQEDILKQVAASNRQQQACFDDRFWLSVKPLRFTADPLALGLGETNTVPIDSLLQVEVLSSEVDDYDLFVTCAGASKEQYPTKWLPFHSQPEPGRFSYINFQVPVPPNDSLVVTIVGKQDTLCYLFTGFSRPPHTGGDP